MKNQVIKGIQCGLHVTSRGVPRQLGDFTDYELVYTLKRGDVILDESYTRSYIVEKFNLLIKSA